MVLKAIVQKKSSKQSPPQVTLKMELPRSPSRNYGRYFYSNIKYQLPHALFYQISDQFLMTCICFMSYTCMDSYPISY